MPTAPRSSPFTGTVQPQPAVVKLRTPQVRILAALVPKDNTLSVYDLPTITRAQLGVRAGYTAISGTITRALNGIRPGSSSGEPHLGLLALKYVEELIFDIDGVQEVNYRATDAGAAAYRAHVAQHGTSLPKLRDRKSCINDRYRSSDAGE